MTNIEEIGARARAAGRRMALISTERKNAALEAIATALTR
jgi:glutamate-5-semialdehyde dehydrogenase